jgi:hypothetical protein
VTAVATEVRVAAVMASAVASAIAVVASVSVMFVHQCSNASNDNNNACVNVHHTDRM